MADSGRPLRIVYVSWEYPPQFGGGIGTYVHAMARTLAARGHRVTVLSISDRTHPFREWTDGVMVLRLPPPTTSEPGAVGTLRAWQERSDAVAEALARLVRGGVDLIEFCDYRGEGVSYLSATRGTERPACVVRLHTPLSVLYRYNTGHDRQMVLEEFEHEALRQADRVVSPSQALADELAGRLEGGLRWDLSPHPVDPGFLAHAAAQASDESRDVLYVGRFEERKGVETLARAAAAFLVDCPESRLVMIGGDTEKSASQRSMKAVVAELIPRALRGRVDLIDRMPREQLVERYRAARLCVFPSHFENFPNTCLEAMALGQCVIGTSRSGMAEMIEHGVSGVIAPSQDADALARAIVRLFRAPASQRAAMGAAARTRIESHYHPAVVAAQLEALYRGYLAVGSAPARPAASGGAPRVAVVIPCYNHGKYLPDALASVRAQTYSHVDCVVVDDGSTDAETIATLDRVRSGGVQVIRQDNAGLAAARNTGVQATDAPYYVALDADDTIEPTFIASLLPALERDPTLGYAYSRVRFFGASGGTWDCPDYDPRRLLVENLSVATALVRRRAFDEIGGYQPDMIYGFEDWDFWIGLLAIGYHGRLMPAPLFNYRKHAGGSMLSQTQKRRGEMVQRMIAHHRRLFASLLEVSLAAKDRMFFTAHMDSWRLREHIAAAGGTPPPPPVEDELYQDLLAAAEADAIENSRFWRLFQAFKRNPLYRALARARWGPDWDAQPKSEAPRERLERLRASRAFRLIQALKRTGPYRWYARRKYGPGFDRTLA